MVDKKGQVVGYARVSSRDQNLDRQLEALADVDKLFPDKASGKNTEDRPELKKMLAYVREGDTIKVKSADRLARSTIDLLTMVTELGERGVKVEFIDNPALSTTTPQGKFTLTLFAAVAELERDMIRERQREGIALAKAAGKYDREPSLTPEQIVDARRRVETGVSKAYLAREFGVSRSTLYAALAGRGVYGRDDTAG